MKKAFLGILIASSLVVSGQKKIDVSAELEKIQFQYKYLLKKHTDISKIPHSLHSDGTYRSLPSDWWCSGFFGASLWYLYEYSQQPFWKAAAHKWTMAVEREQYNTTTHDLGFMVYYPFGHGYRLTGDSTYRRILLQGAKSLLTRFDARRNVIKSWDEFKGYSFPVIIDNMMNLDYLTWAARESKNNSFYSAAAAHADQTITHHFRQDFSSYHVVCYAPDGSVEAKKTHQGAADESAWARGQAWALYGFTMMYRETRDKRYLQQAVKIADFLINHPALPADKIPYWDYNAPAIPAEERDVSAAAIMASALLELKEYVPANASLMYHNWAEEILVSLCSPVYRNKGTEQGGFLLKHSVGHKPGGIEVDVPLIYADYYFIEALLRYQKSGKL